MDIYEDYRKALKAGQREYREAVAAGETPNTLVLDEMIDDILSLQQTYVGLVEIPVELIVGTKTAARQYAFSKSFFPLLDVGSEFSIKWARLCQAHLGDEGIREPIRCFEYYGKFYVQEGNKRVSVLRYFGASTIPGYVTRIMPQDVDSPEFTVYREFLEFYQLAPLYRVRFSAPGQYAKLLAALDMVDQPWSEAYLQRFRASFSRFCSMADARLELGPLTHADALLVYLRYHSFESLHTMPTDKLRQAVSALQQDINALSEPNPVSVSTAPIEPAKESLLDLIIPRGAKYLKIAFIYEMEPSGSSWMQSHEMGRHHLEEIFHDQVETRAYPNAIPGKTALDVIDQAVADGADVIFTTTPPLIGAALRAAARHPGVKILNCSVAMPYPDVRTYYGRIYEGKFITGAIAGAMARDGRIGYVGSYPILGVPASINAFALGARLVNPDVEIDLEWSCLRGDCLDVFRERGITVISNRDVPAVGYQHTFFGLSVQLPDGSYQSLASPVWYWGRLYENIVRSILDGSWNQAQQAAGNRAVNYWWGMNSGVIDVHLSDEIPEGVKALAKILRRDLRAGNLDPFRRMIIAQDGTLKNAGGHTFTPDELLHMDWLCDCIHGQIPPYEDILPMARKMVRLLGVYRDEIPPEQQEA